MPAIAQIQTTDLDTSTSIGLEPISSGPNSQWRQINAYLPSNQRMRAMLARTRVAKRKLTKMQVKASIPVLVDSVTGLPVHWAPTAALPNAAKIVDYTSIDATFFLPDSLAEGSVGQDHIHALGMALIGMRTVLDSRQDPY